MEIRRVREEELEQAAALANEIFCGSSEGYMGDCFPTLFQAGISHSYGAFDNSGKLVSFMGMVPTQIYAGRAALNAYSVGAVCTDPLYRGQGIASRLLDQCREHARKSGASLMFISGDRSLYTRAGSVPFGQAMKFEITPASSGQISMSQNYHLRDMMPEDLFDIHHLLRIKLGSFGWSIHELQQYIGSKPLATIQGQKQSVRIAEAPNGKLAAMAVMAIDDQPRDSKRRGQLIEWAGDPQAAGQLLVDAANRFGVDELTAFLPWQDTLSSLLQQAGIKATMEKNAGTVLLVDAEALIRQSGLDASLEGMSSYSILPNHQFEFITLDGLRLTGGPAELCSLLFDPDSLIRQPGMEFITTIPLPYMYGLYFI